jgi:hypothetical protein
MLLPLPGPVKYQTDSSSRQKIDKKIDMPMIDWRTTTLRGR